jgi:sugar phosphate permease
VHTLYLLSFSIGLAQGPSWPCCAKILQNWLPKSQFATWWSILSTSANVAGALGPFIATSLSTRYHWTYGFMIPGCVCMSVGYLAIMLLRNKPSELGLPDFEVLDGGGEKSNNETDDGYIEDFDDEYQNRNSGEHGDGDDDDNDNDDNKLGHMAKTKMLFKYPFFIVICCLYFFVQLIKTIFSDWSQLYLIKALKIDAYSASYFISCFEVAGIFGSLTAGSILDLIVYYGTKRAAQQQDQQMNDVDQKKKKNSSTSANFRMPIVLIFLLLHSIFLHLFNYYSGGIDGQPANKPLLYLVAVSCGFLSYGSISLLGVTAMQFAPKSISGTSHAIAALSANVGSIFAGLPFGLLSKYYSWNFAFKFVEALTIGMLVVAFLFRNSKSTFEFNKSSSQIEIKKKQK